MVVAAKYQQKF